MFTGPPFLGILANHQHMGEVRWKGSQLTGLAERGQNLAGAVTLSGGEKVFLFTLRKYTVQCSDHGEVTSLLGVSVY